MADLAHLIPLTGRRTSARLLTALIAAALAGGIAGVWFQGRDSSWAALLSLVVPGSSQLVQGAYFTGAILLGVTVLLLADLIVVFGAVLHLGLVPLAALAPAACLHSATHGAWWSLPVGAMAGLAAGIVIEQANVAARRRRRLRVEVAQDALPPDAGAVEVKTVGHGLVRPFDRYGEAFLRYFLRFGHAKPDDWSVFDDPQHLDDALRYQIALTSWGLYVSQHLLTPAFREAAAASVRNLAERCRDHRVWAYTRRQNLASFRIDGDPFGYENVMYSGYAADVVSMYEALSGDRRYDAPCGFSVSDRRRTYDWSHEEIIANLALQHASSPHGAVSCLPGWIWPPCQTFSLRAIQLGDLVHRDDHSWAQRRYREAFQRYFVDRHGKIDTCRSIAGFAHPLYNRMVGVSGQAGTGAMTAPIAREIVERHYEQHVKPRMRRNGDGTIELTLSKIDTYDTSYGWNPVFPYSLVLLYAAEMGDSETVAGLRATLETMLTPEGAERPGPGSIVSMAFTFLGLVNTEQGLASAHAHVPAYDTTPELESAPYPKVIVTSATTDGTNVHTTLSPGPDANGPVEIRFARLVPGARYRLTGGEEPFVFTAGRDGRLRSTVDSTARHDLVLARAG